MAGSVAEVFVGHGAGKGADASLQEEAERTHASRSSNGSEDPPQDSQVPREEDEEASRVVDETITCRPRSGRSWWGSPA